MESIPRREAALRLLETTGMWRSSYEPPALRLLWRLGVDAPPPHFAGFGASALAIGSFFGLAWGLAMWLFLWRSQAVPAAAVVIAAVGAGLLFGISMATYYAFGRRKYKLPPWHGLQAGSAGA
jgi:hypothetical protein